jgi:hypothetical protein
MALLAAALPVATLLAAPLARVAFGTGLLAPVRDVCGRALDEVLDVEALVRALFTPA